MEKALNTFCSQAEEASRGGYQLIILSDRNAGPDRVPVSTLLVLGNLKIILIFVFKWNSLKQLFLDRCCSSSFN